MRQLRWLMTLVVGSFVLAACGTQQADTVPIDEVLIASVAEIDVKQSGSDGTHNGAVFIQVPDGDVSGTGVFDPFMRVQAQGNRTVQNGFNTDVKQPSYDGNDPRYEARDPKTIARLLSTIPSVDYEGERYREVFLDLNESGNNPFLSLDDLNVYVVDGPENDRLDLSEQEFKAGVEETDLVWQLNEPGESPVFVGLADLSTGSGRPDYRFLIPEAAFEEYAESCSYGATGCDRYFVMHVRMGAQGGDYGATSTFEEFNTKIRPALEVTKTAEVDFTRTFTWEVEKSVDPEEHHLFEGDEADSSYTVSVTQTGHVDSDFTISGTVTITNTTTVAGLLHDVSDVYVPTGEDPEDVDLDCGVTFPYTLAGGATLVCTYEHASASGGENRVTVVLMDPADDQSTTYVATADATAGEPTTVVDAQVDVYDVFEGTEVFLGSVSETTTFDSYDRTFDCTDVTFADGAGVSSTATYSNTARIEGAAGTLDHDTAEVDVTCYRPLVSMDAETSFTRTYEWDVEKLAVDEFGNPVTEPITVGVGGDVTLHYDIIVSLTGFSDSGWAVSGAIDVTNPHPTQALTVTVSDVVSPDIAATVDCNGSGDQLTMAAGATETCTYSAPLNDAETRSNTAYAETEFGVTYASAAVPVVFGDPTDEQDAAVDVYDDFAGGGNALVATVGLGDLDLDGTARIPVQRSAGVGEGYDFPLECGENVIDNTATIVAVDSQTSAWDDASVTVILICECATETAWSAGDLYQHRWFTYTPYHGEALTVDLIAGQTSVAGTVHFSAPDVDGNVVITIALSGGWEFASGTNVHIQGYDQAPSNVNPAPGQFEYKFAASGTSFTSPPIPAADYFGVHAVVEDCGF